MFLDQNMLADSERPQVPPMSDEMTVQFCLDTCEQAGYPVAGLEYGKDCWCGPSMPQGVSPAPNCNMGCSGDGSQ